MQITPAAPLAELRGADQNELHRPIDQRIRRSGHACVFPGEHHDLHQLKQLVDVFPARQLQRLIAADQPEERIVRITRDQRAGGIDRIGDAGALQLHRAHADPAVRRRGALQHGDAVRILAQRTALEGRIMRRHQPHLIHAHLQRFLSDLQMPGVHRVKASSQHCDLHLRAPSDSSCCADTARMSCRCCAPARCPWPAPAWRPPLPCSAAQS